MGLTDEQRRQIFALRGKMSARACGKIVGCSDKTVATLWKTDGSKNPFHARAMKEDSEGAKSNTSQCEDSNSEPPNPNLPHPGTIAVCDFYCKAENIRAEMVANLFLTKEALKQALSNLNADPNNNDNIKTVATISKSVQNAIEDLAKWIGMDKASNDVRRVNAEEIDIEDAVTLLREMES